mmetsp:Transcript_10485/g.10552  ORF Transcript_10485/g.10552 Transcript_10485/m.10552 type:complete len:397 (+) Transcript_10485:87-1277(+)|eukprot:CAMPEP_0182432858 /NCGR_PEP_ID=MMETSP1167-20130531/59363_1 /TAXON_ID=2988 /ORGANISM="Mallomonas Sp, Strain CCMP3275" /LENGTH=396 /DNA_ID=CAMNT_0024620871 /DNA_START=84 /DNA_END=1274 /DNA_ORIENTATION=-
MRNSWVQICLALPVHYALNFRIDSRNLASKIRQKNIPFSSCEPISYRVKSTKGSAHNLDSCLRYDRINDKWPTDSVNNLYVGDWKYWYRRSGMLTSTDDIITAYVAQNIYRANIKDTSSEVKLYVELGCGVGSILWLVAYNLQPVLSIGIEAQHESAMMSLRTLKELPIDAPDIQIWHRDIRTLGDTFLASPKYSSSSLTGQCDLITANPPYSRCGTGTLPKDTQKMFSHFELRGGVEDYMLQASKLLRPSGRLVLCYWTKHQGDRRVRDAAELSGLYVASSTEVMMGRVRTKDEKNQEQEQEIKPSPQLIVYELMLLPVHSVWDPDDMKTDSNIRNMTKPKSTYDNSNSAMGQMIEKKRCIDIRVPAQDTHASSGGYSDSYRNILQLLHIHPRQR